MSKSKPVVVIMDGAMGTMLLLHGVPSDACLEELNLSRPGLIREIHRSYSLAGAGAILANTFGANRSRLASYGSGLVKKLAAINRAGIRAAKEAAGRKPAFASIGPLGRMAKKMPFSEMFAAFKEQAKALEKESFAGYVVETMMSLTEAEAATAAVRKVSGRKIITMMTKTPGGRDLTPEAAELIAATLRAAGADVIGANCGLGPGDSLSLLKAFSKIDPGPFAVRIAGGVPGRSLSPNEFADWGPKFLKVGCRWIGGCCGTTPAHIRALKFKLLP